MTAIKAEFNLRKNWKGAWLAPSVKHATLDPAVVSVSSTLGAERT